MYVIVLYFIFSTWLKERGAFPVATVTGVWVLVCVIQSFSLQTAVEQLLQWLSIRPARDHLPVHKRRKHGGLQEPRQEVQVGRRLNWEEGTLKRWEAQTHEQEYNVSIANKSVSKIQKSSLCGNNWNNRPLCALTSTEVPCQSWTSPLGCSTRSPNQARCGWQSPHTCRTWQKNVQQTPPSAECSALQPSALPPPPQTRVPASSLHLTISLLRTSAPEPAASPAPPAPRPRGSRSFCPPSDPPAPGCSGEGRWWRAQWSRRPEVGARIAAAPHSALGLARSGPGTRGGPRVPRYSGCRYPQSTGWPAQEKETNNRVKNRKNTFQLAPPSDNHNRFNPADSFSSQGDKVAEL